MRRAGRGDPRGAEWLIEHLDRRLAGEAPVVVGMDSKELSMLGVPRFRWRGPLIAAGSLAVAMAIALPILLLGGGDDAAPVGATTSSEPATTEAPTTVAPTSTAAPGATAATQSTPTTTPDTTAAPSTTAAVPPVETVVTWERVPDQPDLSGVGDGASLWTVVEFDGRLYAGGLVTRPGTRYEGQLSDAAVWVSENARDWRLVTVWEDPDGLGAIVQLVAGPEVLIAAAQKQVWVSSDGETWSEVADPGTPSGTWLPVPDGWIVVVGEYPAAGSEVWLVSPDATDWRAAEVVGLPGADPVRATRMFDAAQAAAGFVAVGFDEAGSHVVGRGGNSVCGAIWFSETGVVWEQLDVPLLCEEEPMLRRVWVTPAGEVVARGVASWWSSADPADPNSWRSIPEPVLNLDAAIGEVGVLLPVRGLRVWNLGGYGGDGRFCVSDDGGVTCLEVDTTTGPFAAPWAVDVADGLVFGDEFVIVGSESVSGGFPGPAAVWIGTPSGE